MLEWSALQSNADSVAAFAAALATNANRIQAGVANLKAENEALRAQIDPEAQTRINTLAAALGQTATSLSQTNTAIQAIADGLPTIPPPGPPA